MERDIEEIIEEIKELIASIEKRLDKIEGGKADKHHSHPHYIPISERRM